jgi:phosphate transport system protein
MERHFDEQLGALKALLVKMSALAEVTIADALRVLVQRDAAAAAAVARHEEQVNALQIEVDEMCFTLIATHQPVAGDLRFLLGAVKTNSDLERLADQAVNISEKAESLLRYPPVKPFVIIPEMAAIAGGMAKDSLHAYVNRDVTLARRVLLRDDDLDERKRRVTAELVEHIRHFPDTATACIELILVARNLERIGDHATNICENAIFVVQGKDIRHHAEDAPPKA